MSGYTFDCPRCNQSLEAPEDMLGQTIECPSCKASIELPKSNSQPQPDPPVEMQHLAQSPPSPPQPKQTKDCQFCGETILASARKCKHCGEFLDGTRPKQEDPAPPSDTSRAPKIGKPMCQQCGASMRKTVASSGNCSGIVVALIVFAVGIFIAIALPVIGWIIGPIICIGALFMGGKRQKVWKCTKCGSVVNRA